MARKDYYAILRVERDETSGGIRAAFRDLARQYHPDFAGPGGTPVFREVVEAYRTLSDPDLRSDHDAELESVVHLGVRGTPPSFVEHVGEVRPPRFGGISVFGHPDAIRPSADALLERIFRNFTGRGVPKFEQPEPLFCDIALSPEEARRGGVLPIQLPEMRPCPACHGTGRRGLFTCAGCTGDGQIRDERTVPVRIPPGILGGTQLDISLDRWGIRNLWLRVRVGVG